ncbi:hypothetical protein ABZ897_09490 [Nonomuraea sp. NPDC046802]|uniref:hypothetical protein n=1 Tax=Nonomuraea sp. NPDC046802 TaxID=3154919 RepID=UPI0033DECA7D
MSRLSRARRQIAALVLGLPAATVFSAAVAAPAQARPRPGYEQPADSGSDVGHDVDYGHYE